MEELQNMVAKAGGAREVVHWFYDAMFKWKF